MRRLAEFFSFTSQSSRETCIVPVALPSELSRRFPEFLPTWRHRSVSKSWQRTILRTRLKQALEPSENWSMTQLLRVSCSYFEGGSDYLARRLKLGPPSEELTGTAEAILLRGNVDGPEPSEVARGEGTYQCEIENEQGPMLRLQLVRVAGGSGRSAASVGDSQEELLVPVVKALFQRF